MIGYGAVASVHARQLAEHPDATVVSIVGPDEAKLAAFASAHDILRVSTDLAGGLLAADVAIICSPSALHFEQARECLQAGVHTLVELPACEKTDEARELGNLAERTGVRLGCAHTSRYLAPYVLTEKIIHEGELGPIREINYIRHLRPRERNWTDNALLHHAAHPLDLLLNWFGAIEPRGCVVAPGLNNIQTVAMLGSLLDRVPVTISVSYVSPGTVARMLIVGERHMLETDGFSFVRSDLKTLTYDGEEQATYERAIHDQDFRFLDWCKGEGIAVPWGDTLRLIRTVSAFRGLGG